MATEDNMNPDQFGGYKAKHAKPGVGSFFGPVGSHSGTYNPGRHAAPGPSDAPKSKKKKSDAMSSGSQTSASDRRKAARAAASAHKSGKSATGLSGAVKKATSKVRGK